MLKRTLTAFLLIPPVVYLIGWSPIWLFLVALVAAVVLALREYFGLCRAMGFKVFSAVGYAGAVALCFVQTFPLRHSYYSVDRNVAAWMIALVLVISALAMHHSTDLKDYLAASATTIFGILYIGLSLSFLVRIRLVGAGVQYSDDLTERPELSLGANLVLFLFAVIWAGDICAYLVGRSMGHTPFFARISPRKTWEGAVAGLVGSLLAGVAYHHWFWTDARHRRGNYHYLIFAMLLATWIAVAGQLGDLVESAIKRGANQKDSGTLLPGHGGFLDRIDSLLFAVPAMWLALLVLGYFS
jgi:phosphatidate cytidylyltransferase